VEGVINMYMEPPFPLAPYSPALRGHEELGGRRGGEHFGLWLSEP
jgi:hypothetical protein